MGFLKGDIVTQCFGSGVNEQVMQVAGCEVVISQKFLIKYYEYSFDSNQFTINAHT